MSKVIEPQVKLPQIKITQQIVAFEYTTDHQSFGPGNGMVMICLRLHDGGFIKYQSTLEEAESLRDHLYNRTPAVITIG
jgi:hypothetical protein